MKTVTKNMFEDVVVNSKKPVLLDFWATWCGPCQMLTPIMEELDAERDDLMIGKVDVDAEPELAVRFRVVSIPTVILLQDGKEIARSVGYLPKEELLQKLGI